MKRSVLIAFLFLGLIAHAQSNLPLTIGDKVPDRIIGYDINNPKKKIRLYDIKASLILLDFFSSGCSACLHDISKLDSLQKQFSSRVKLLTITTETPEELRKTFNKLKWSWPSLTIIKTDSAFARLFPYNTVPHHAWLDSSYHVRYITNSWNATAENFNSFLTGKQLILPTKFELPDFDETQPLWLEGNGRLYNYLQYYSYIMKKIKGYNGNNIHRMSNKQKGTIGFSAINISLLSLIKAAWEQYPEPVFENNNRIVLDVKDSSVFLAPTDRNEYQNWLQKNAYCYELRLPVSKKNQMFFIMQQDLLRFFNYDIRIEKRKIPCLVLLRTSQEDKIRTKGYREQQANRQKDSIRWNDLPLSMFVRSLNNMNRDLKTPFIDETNYINKVDLLLGCWYTDIEKLKQELHKYDLELKEEEKTIDILVIRDKKEGSN